MQINHVEELRTPYPNAGTSCPESILYLELIDRFAMVAYV